MFKVDAYSNGVLKKKPRGSTVYPTVWYAQRCCACLEEAAFSEFKLRLRRWRTYYRESKLASIFEVASLLLSSVAATFSKAALERLMAPMLRTRMPLPAAKTDTQAVSGQIAFSLRIF